MLTIASVLALAYVMNLSVRPSPSGRGSRDGRRLRLPFRRFSGWLRHSGLRFRHQRQCLFATTQGGREQGRIDPALLVAANTAGGVVGKMISPQEPPSRDGGRSAQAGVADLPAGSCGGASACSPFPPAPSASVDAAVRDASGPTRRGRGCASPCSRPASTTRCSPDSRAVVSLLRAVRLHGRLPMGQTCCGQMFTNTGISTSVHMPTVRQFVEVFAAYDHIVAHPDRVSARCAAAPHAGRPQW